MTVTQNDEAAAETEEPARVDRTGLVWRVALILAVCVVGGILLSRIFDFLRDTEANRLLVVAVAIVVGVGGVFFLFWAMNEVVNWMPARFREGVRPYVFVGPAVVVLSVFLIYPVINTIFLSFKDATGQEFVGLDNYGFAFTDDSMLRSLRNTAGWIIVVPLVAVSVGLAFATLADRLRRGEAVAKSLIFLPMAISFVGAAVTFRLIYSYRPAGFGTNIGLLNGIWSGLGNEPVAWLSRGAVEQRRTDGDHGVDADRLRDGGAVGGHQGDPGRDHRGGPHRRCLGVADLPQRDIVPSILPTIVVVTTYMVINALKVFDIVFVMGNAETIGTEVVAERMIRWYFIQGNDGRAAAIAVILFIAVVPVMLWNVRKFREQEAMR